MLFSSMNKDIFKIGDDEDLKKEKKDTLRLCMKRKVVRY